MGLVKWIASHQEFRCYVAKIEESVKGRQPLGVEPRTPLAWATSALPVSYGNRTITNPHLWVFRVRKPLSMGSFLMERIFQSTPMKFTQYIRVAARCATEAFSTTCAVHIEDCKDWWLSGCHSSVAERWRLKPEVSWVRLLAAAGLFTFLYFHLITSKFSAWGKMLWAVLLLLVSYRNYMIPHLVSVNN